jgi:hypothetical protein
MPKFCHNSLIKAFIPGVQNSDCYSWEKNIYAVLSGSIIQVKDRQIEKEKVSIFKDYFTNTRFKPNWDKNIFVRKSNFFSKKQIIDLEDKEKAEDLLIEILGNYIIIKHLEGVYSLYAHLSANSICVEKGQFVHEGDLLGKVGNTGHSLCPHLHFQLMNIDDLWKAQGIKCSFRKYDEIINDQWIEKNNSIPGQPNKIRYIPE